MIDKFLRFDSPEQELTILQAAGILQKQSDSPETTIDFSILTSLRLSSTVDRWPTEELAEVGTYDGSQSTSTCPNSRWDKCGGQDFLGPTCCPDGDICQYSNDWYSQCVQDPSTIVTPSPSKGKKKNWWDWFGRKKRASSDEYWRPRVVLPLGLFLSQK